MNEMKQLEDFCAEVPPPDPDRLARTRALVLSAAAGLDSAGTRRGRGRLGTRITPPRLTLPHLTLPRLALTGGLAAVAAVAVAIALVSPAGPGAGTGSGPGSRVRLDAAVVLHRAAIAALTAPAPGRGQFLYVTVHGVSTSHGLRRTYQQRTWLPAVNGPGHRWRQGVIEQTPCMTFAGSGSCVMVDPQIRGDWSEPTYAWLSTLPSAPGALLAYLEHHSACTFSTVPVDTSHAAYSEVYTILSAVYLMPGRLGAALFTAAARIPGVRVLRHVTTAAGQPGIAVAMTARATPAAPAAHAPLGPPLRYELIFSPRSYRFIGLQAVTARGVITSGQAVTSARVTPHAPRTHSIAMWSDNAPCLA